MSDQPCVLFVHAHPDDEASKGSATVAKLVDDGVRCVLVCCTGGEAGEVLNPQIEVPDDPEALAALRRAELEDSCAILGFAELHWLGYRDSGMKDTEHNAHPGCFAAAEFDEAVGRLVRIIRAERPHVLVGYFEDREMYGHPDHVRVHEITRAAYDAAADPARFPEAGEPWRVAKLYEAGFTRRNIEALADAYDVVGGENPFREWMLGWQALGLPEPDPLFRTQIDIGAYLHKRRASLLAHRTQIDPEGFWMRLTDEQLRAAYPYEDYALVHAHVPVPDDIETDLLTGLEFS